MEPINYMMNLPNPATAVFEGYAQGLGQQGARQDMDLAAAQEARRAELQPFAVQGAQLGLDQGRQNMAINADANARANEMQPYQVQQAQQTTEAQAVELDRARGFQTEMAGLRDLGKDATLTDFQGVAMAYPEYGESLMGTFGAMNKAQQDSVVGVLGQATYALKAGQTDVAMELIDDYAAAAERSGNQELTATAQGIRQLAEADPQSALASMGLALQTLAPDVNERIFDVGESRVQSSVMVGPTLSVQTMSNGSTRVVDTVTGEAVQGDAARQAIRDAQASEVLQQTSINAGRESGKLGAQVATGEQAAAAGSLGGERGPMVKEAFTAANGIASSIGNMQTAINAIDEGARAGAIQRYIPDITEASASLRNSMDRMGLDVIGSVTFGALSEAEMNLAMSVAVPRNLDEVQLRSWLEDKLEAQRKVRSAILEQAQFLSDPGNTLEDWAEIVGGRATEPDAVTPPPAAEAPSYLQYGAP